MSYLLFPMTIACRKYRAGEQFLRRTSASAIVDDHVESDRSIRRPTLKSALKRIHCPDQPSRHCLCDHMNDKHGRETHVEVYTSQEQFYCVFHHVHLEGRH